MIKEVFLGDFQGFMGATANLAPLTLVFGPNGSGKSSIGRALKLMKQSSSKELSNPGYVFKGNEIEFGSSKDAIRGQLKSRELPSDLSLGLTLTSNLFPSVGYAFQEDLRSSRIKIHLRAEKHNGEGFLVGSFSSVGKRFSADNCFFISEALGWLSLTEEIDEALNTFGEYLQIRGNLAQIVAPEGFPGSWEDAFDLDHDDWAYRFFSSLEMASSIFQEALSSTTFIEPLRPIPSKLQLTDDTRVPGAAVPGNDRAKDRLLADLMLRLTDERYELIVRNVPLHELDVMVQAKYVVDSHTGAELGFDQVGTGISQVAPLVHDLVLGHGTTYIEQPELHLHPRMQSLLMTEYIEAVQRDPSRQFIIETHSETMLLKVQKRIREGSLDPKQVSILFVNKAELDDGTKFNSIEKLNLDELGDFLDPLPISFMDIRMQDLL